MTLRIRIWIKTPSKLDLFIQFLVSKVILKYQHHLLTFMKKKKLSLNNDNQLSGFGLDSDPEKNPGPGRQSELTMKRCRTEQQQQQQRQQSSLSPSQPTSHGRLVQPES